MIVARGLILARAVIVDRARLGELGDWRGVCVNIFFFSCPSSMC